MKISPEKARERWAAKERSELIRRKCWNMLKWGDTRRKNRVFFVFFFDCLRLAQPSSQELMMFTSSMTACHRAAHQSPLLFIQAYPFAFVSTFPSNKIFAHTTRISCSTFAHVIRWELRSLVNWLTLIELLADNEPQHMNGNRKFPFSVFFCSTSSSSRLEPRVVCIIDGMWEIFIREYEKKRNASMHFKSNIIPPE